MSPSKNRTEFEPRSASDARLSIAAVERATGLGKDTLRVWERRYGFPSPTRDAAGDRVYSAEQVRRLKRIRSLLDAGLRPGKIVGLDDAALQALLAQHTTTPSVDSSRTDIATPLVQDMLRAIGTHDARALLHGLGHAQMRMGMERFVTGLVAPLTVAVGDAWAQGRFQVHEEHLYTETITGVLRSAIASLPLQPAPPGPNILLTTVPDEPHGLGLLMVEALLAVDGCTCISLGTQTPLDDIARAAREHRVDVVGLSFSNVHKPATVHTTLRELRAHLADTTALWVGGGCPALYERPLAGVSAVQALSGLQPLVMRWRRAHGKDTDTSPNALNSIEGGNH